MRLPFDFVRQIRRVQASGIDHGAAAQIERVFRSHGQDNTVISDLPAQNRRAEDDEAPGGIRDLLAEPACNCGCR